MKKGYIDVSNSACSSHKDKNIKTHLVLTEVGEKIKMTHNWISRNNVRVDKKVQLKCASVLDLIGFVGIERKFID